MTERQANSPYSNSAPLILRFRLMADLQPDAAADARVLTWSPNDDDWVEMDAQGTEFQVYSTFARAFGKEGEELWAMYFLDNNRWEVISMEGCLLRHGTVTEEGGIAEGATGDIALYWNNDSDTEATLGITIQARNIGAALDNGDKVQVWYEPHGEKWYVCNGTGSGGAIVSVASATRDETMCLWAGNVQSIEGTPTSFCTNQFTTGEDCWLMVMDAEGGSTAGFKATLTVGEFYFGHLITTISDVPVYAIRISSQIFHMTAGSGISVGSFTAQSLPDGRSVNVYNWGTDNITAGDKISVYHDKWDDKWYAIKSGGSGAKTWKGIAADPIAPNASGTITLAVGTAEATNWGTDNIAVSDHTIVWQDPLNGLYYTMKPGGAAAVVRFELTADLPIGTSATAETMEYAAGVWSTTGTEITVADFTGRTFTGLSGYRGWCVLATDDSDHHEIVWMEHEADWAQIRLDRAATMEFSVEHYWGDGNEPPASDHLQDPDTLFQRRVNNTSGIALFDPHEDQYVLVQCETWAGAITFTLNADIPDDGTAVSADRLEYFGSQQDRVDPSDEYGVLSVRDESTLFRHAKKGGKGIGILDAIDGVYYPVVVDQRALIGEVRLAVDMAATDIAGTCEELSPYTPFPFSQVVAGLTLVKNQFGCAGKIGTTFPAVFDSVSGAYVPLPRARTVTECISNDELGVRGVGVVFAMGQEFDAVNVGDEPLEANCTALLIEDTYTNQLLVMRAGVPLLIRAQGGTVPDSIFGYDVAAVRGVEAAAYSGSVAIGVGRENSVFTGLTLVNFATSIQDTPSATIDMSSAQKGTIVHATFGGEETPALGEMWGAQPGKRNLRKGYPGYVAIGVDTELYWGANHASPTATFEKQPVQILLVKTNGAISNNSAANFYSIQCGNQGGEIDGGWDTVPEAYNRSGRTIDTDEWCVLFRLPSGWYISPLRTGSGATEWKAVLSADLLRTDPSGTVDIVVALDGSGTDIGTTTIQNPYGLAGTENDSCLIGVDASDPEDVTYFFKQIQHHVC